jgi:Lamin Tail Domain
MPNSLTANNTFGEWFELYDNGPSPVNLTGWTFNSKTPSNVTEMFTVTTPWQIAPGAYLVLGPNNLTSRNANYTAQYEYTREPNATSGYNRFGLDDDTDYIFVKNALNETVYNELCYRQITGIVTSYELHHNIRIKDPDLTDTVFMAEPSISST